MIPQIGVYAACAVALLLGSTTSLLAADDSMKPAPVVDSATLPPAIGEIEPMVVPVKDEEGIYHQAWFPQSFLDLKDDFAEAKAAGKRFAVLFEQRGCIYCVKMHKEVLAQRYINDYVRKNFHIVQMDLWGAREATDFDGKALTEKKLADRWGVLFTPTIVFFKDDVSIDGKAWGRDLEVARMSLGMGPGTFYDMFVWINERIYNKNKNFQRFHLQRYHERETLRAAGKDDKATKTN